MQILSFKVYGKTNCRFCVNAIELLKAKDVNFDYVDVTQDEHALAFIKSQGATTVPQVYNGDDLIGGYEDLFNHFNK